jgi:hypothetical protein
VGLNTKPSADEPLGFTIFGERIGGILTVGFGLAISAALVPIEKEIIRKNVVANEQNPRVF